jgi:hypothetical protein
MHLKNIFLVFIFSTTTLFGEKTTNTIDSTYFVNNLNIFSQGNNIKRCEFVKKHVVKDSLKNLVVKTEAIDWLGIYRNIIVEKKGECDSIVYIVCHYDKIDGNIFSMINTLLIGDLDILLSNTTLSRGAYDNGTGVVISLSLLSWINNKNTHYTYRFLFAGMEEYGLRGSRRHVSGLKKEDWKKCFYAINIDMVGKKCFSGISVSQNVSDSMLVKTAEVVCIENNYTLLKTKVPTGALSDYFSFKGQNFGKDFGISLLVNFLGAFIPQRSYFTKKKKGIPIINFSDDSKITASDLLSIYSPVSFGEIHSFKDKQNVINSFNLLQYHYFMKDLLLTIDSQKCLYSQKSHTH